MTHLAQNAVGDILDHYADVIEGGNAYASGDSFLGIPGTYSRHPGILSGDDTPLTAAAAGTTTSIEVANTYSWPSNRWVRGNAPGFFLLCTSGEDRAVSEARRITAWDNTSKRFTVDAFTVAPGDGATFSVFEGFKRLPDTIDINAEGTDSALGYDRFFNLALTPQLPLDWYGNGTETWQGELAITLRHIKHARLHQWQAAVAQNLTIIASAMTLTGATEHRDSTHVRALLRPTDAAEVVLEDQHKIVSTLRLPIVYRIERGY